MKKSIKQELKSFALKLRSEIIKRDKFYMSKTETWQESKSGDKYSYISDVLNELWPEIETCCNEVEVKIPYLK